MAPRTESSSNRLDDAAQAGWLCYVADNTQEEIAAKLGTWRQSAQRLVSLSVSAGLIKVRLDHPIGRCLSAAAWIWPPASSWRCLAVTVDDQGVCATCAKLPPRALRLLKGLSAQRHHHAL